MRNAAFLAVLALALAVALAGCSGGGSDDATAPGEVSSASSSTTGPPPKPVVLSDTLHLLAPPEMALVLPEGSQETSTGTAMNFGGGGGGGEPMAQWAFQVSANSTVVGAEIHVWVEIRDTFLQPVDPRTPQDSCTWIVTLALGADGSEERGCLTEPPGPISAGTRELIFDLVGLDGGLEVNETIMFSFNRRAFSASADDSVFVLFGSAEHDSRLVLKGLKEPVPDA